MCIYIYVCMYIYMYVCIYIYVCMYVCKYIYMYVYMTRVGTCRQTEECCPTRTELTQFQSGFLHVGYK